MPPISKHAAQQQLSSARQKTGETAHAYARRIKELFRALNDASTTGVGNAETLKYILSDNERSARHIFEDGLTNGELRTYTRSGRNTDLASVISQAMDGRSRCCTKQQMQLLQKAPALGNWVPKEKERRTTFNEPRALPEARTRGKELPRALGSAKENEYDK